MIYLNHHTITAECERDGWREIATVPVTAYEMDELVQQIAETRRGPETITDPRQRGLPLYNHGDCQ